MIQPLPQPEWRDLLPDSSNDYLGGADERERAYHDVAQRESRWLVYEPSSEESILATEERLGVRLPPSYRNFLRVSDSWCGICPMLDELRKVGEICRF